MLRGRKASTTWIVLVAVSLTLSACGGAAKKEQAATQTTQTTQTTSTAPDTSPAGVQKCLTAVGLKVVTSGDLPVIRGSKAAVGLRLPGGGNFMPGHLSAAIFWYGTTAKALSMWKSSVHSFFAMQVDNLVVVYNPSPSSTAVMNKIEACMQGR